MIACIPTNGDSGPNDTVCAHFGSAPFFTIVNSDNGEITILQNQNAHHDHGTCHPMKTLASHPLDCVVCRGMGRRAIETLNAQGMRVFRAPSESVADAIQALKANSLREMDMRQACAGHEGLAH